MGKPLIIVESPAKARTMAKFLGDDYKVEASVGHIRDLPENAAAIPAKYRKLAWARTGIDIENDFKPLYVLTTRGRTQVKKLKALIKDAPVVYLATDEDREGEAIAWHLIEELKPKVPVLRLVFHEITATAIEAALNSPRDLNLDLVRAQETRRIIDRLYGFNVSPVLWRKVKPRLSAGRVQSVATRLVVERERARMAFVSASWWDVAATFEAKDGGYAGRLTSVGDQKVATGRDFDPDTGELKTSAARRLVLEETMAGRLKAALDGGTARVADVTSRRFTERPAPPFITSTLQQEANKRLRWSAKRTMGAAQRLYENGWITYMRTDSTNLSEEAITGLRDRITEDYGAKFCPSEPRVFKSKAKGAQEAHEAIRPAGQAVRPVAECQRTVGGDEARLYEMIVKRSLACQMRDAEGVRVSVDTEIDTPDGKANFRSSGKTYSFEGFRRAYVERTDEDAPEGEGLLPPLASGDEVKVTNAEAAGHLTQPPARLTEASLVKGLEAKGIGRPSTYATIIETIQSRGYVFKRGTALVPTWTAFAVTRLMEQHFDRLVDYDFTANLEGGLDEIAQGQRTPLAYLKAFYGESKSDKDGLVALIDSAQESADPRAIGTFELRSPEGAPVVARVGRYGPYLQSGDHTASIPDDLAPDELTLDKIDELLNMAAEGPRVLGTHPESGDSVTLHIGRFGPYVQLGEVQPPPPKDGKKKKKPAPKPKRQSLLEGMEPDTVDLETAVKLLALPRELGKDDSKRTVIAAIGRYGPYVRAGEETRRIPAPTTPLDITLEQALALLKESKKRGRVLSELGKDSEGRAVTIKDGRYGPYCTDGQTHASLGKAVDPKTITLEIALEMLQKKREANGDKKSSGKTKRA